MIRALLVTAFTPQQTGLADYAKRILSLTDKHIEWTVAYPSAAKPSLRYLCKPINALTKEDFKQPAIFQIGNSLHCEEVIQAFLKYGGTGLFHETNMHHVLREHSNITGDWQAYNNHIKADYREQASAIQKIMAKKADSLSEYDHRLRVYPLVGNLLDASRVIATLSDSAKRQLQKLAGDREIIKMGFLPDFLGKEPRAVRTGDEYTIGIAGTFHYGRSWETMLKAVELLRKSIKCKLLVVGSGWPETEHPWVTVTGRLPDVQFRKQLEKIDIALDLRFYTCGETSGSMMDILRSGIPAVLSSEGTFCDLPADAVLRISADSGELGAFAALKYLIENKDIRESVSRNAAAYFAEVSDKAKCLSEWLELIDRSEP